MKINEVKIENYKSFEDSGWLPLSPKVTVVVGQNNSGKSAFLDAFRSNWQNLNRPHLGPKRAEGAPHPELSKVVFRLTLEGQELLNSALRFDEFWLPFPMNYGREPAAEVAQRVFRDGVKRVEIARSANGDSTWPGDPGHGLFDLAEKMGSLLLKRTSDYRDFKLLNVTGTPTDNIKDVSRDVLASSTFVFDAQRTIPGSSPIGDVGHLRADAQNLASMLLQMVTRDNRGFLEYLELVREVLPSIQYLSGATEGSSAACVHVWTDASQRRDLGIRLEHCGTGVGQVLAILLAIKTLPPSVLVIDEPGSFLHPGATKALLSIIQRFDHHQYILSTHSPDVISTLQPDVILSLSFDPQDGETKVRTTHAADYGALQELLSDLGCTLSDVFGFERIIFVEGATEERCFRLVAGHHGMRNINFVAMRDASAALGRRRGAEELFDIYGKAVRSTALTPPRVAFSFDSDDKASSERDDIRRKSQGRAFFLPRPMIENYLLHPEAIARVLNTLEPRSFAPVDAASINAWISDERSAYYFPNAVNDNGFHAAKLLGALFAKFTNGTWTYDKIKHGAAITTVILDIEPIALKELADYIDALVLSLG